jgi:ribosomal protein L7/L12
MEQDPLKTPMPAAAVAALHQGNKIEAIKLVREAHHTGLKEAKDMVDAYLEANPSTQAVLAAAARSGKQALWWLAVAVAVAVLAYIVLAKP